MDSRWSPTLCFRPRTSYFSSKYVAPRIRRQTAGEASRIIFFIYVSSERPTLFKSEDGGTPRRGGCQNKTDIEVLKRNGDAKGEINKGREIRQRFQGVGAGFRLLGCDFPTYWRCLNKFNSAILGHSGSSSVLPVSTVHEDPA